MEERVKNEVRVKKKERGKKKERVEKEERVKKKERGKRKKEVNSSLIYILFSLGAGFNYQACTVLFIGSCWVKVLEMYSYVDRVLQSQDIRCVQYS